MADATDMMNQVKKIWSNLSGGQKVGVGALTTFVFLGILGFTLIAGDADYKQLASGLPADEMTALITRLDDAGISDYKISNNGGTVLVNTEVYEAAEMALYRTGGIPRGLKEESDGGLFGSGSGLNRDRAAYDQARKTEKRLNLTLSRLDYIDYARVTITPEQKSRFKKHRKPAKAHVQIHTPGALGDHQIQTIAHTVAGGVAALSPDQVSISDNHGVMLLRAGNKSSRGSEDFLAMQGRVERERAENAQIALDRVYGPNKVLVKVSVDLDWTRKLTKTRKNDPESKVVTLKSKSETKSSRAARASGAVGVGKTTSSDTAKGSPGNRDSEQTTTVQENALFDQTETEIAEMGGDIMRMTAAVFIDESIDAGDKSIEGVIANALGIDPARGDLISYHRTKIQGPPEPLQVDEGIGETVSTFLPLADLILYVVIGLGFLFFALKTIKKAQNGLREALAASLVEPVDTTNDAPVTLEEAVIRASSEDGELAGRTLRQWLYEGAAE